MSRYFKALNYTLGDEDSRLELALLPDRSKNVVAIAGSGARVLPLLAKDPGRLVCVDILAEQLSLLRLRLALLSDLDRCAFLSFLGYRVGMDAPSRRALFRKLALPSPDRELLAHYFDAIAWGPLIYSGRFERMLLTLHNIVSALTGKAGRDIFDAVDMDEQREYYRSRFPHLRWKAVLALLGNSTVLNSLLYSGDFPRNNLGISTFSRYEEIFRHLFTEIPVRTSFFLQMLFLGRIVHDEGLPPECDVHVYSAARRALPHCEIVIAQSDAIDHVAGLYGVDFVSISDVPSFLPDDRARSFLQRMRASLSPAALVVARGHMRVAHPDQDGFEDVSAAHVDVLACESTGLWKTSIYQRRYD